MHGNLVQVDVCPGEGCGSPILGMCTCMILWEDYPFAKELRLKISVIFFFFTAYDGEKRYGKKSPLTRREEI